MSKGRPSSYSRRTALRLGGRIAATGVVGGLAAKGIWDATAPATASGDEQASAVRIGYLPITDASALLVAHEKGFLAEQGISSADPVMFRSWEALAQALAIGEIDVAHVLMPLAVQLRLDKRIPLKVIGWGHVNGSALTVANQIGGIAELAGSTVAIPYWWSIHNVVLQRLLIANGLTAVIRGAPAASKGTVQLAVMAPADMVPALAGGQVSGFVVADPFSAVAEAKGVGKVARFLGDVWKEHACCAVVLREDLIDSAPEKAQAVATAVVKAQGWIEQNRPGMGALLGDGKYLPQPATAVQRVFSREATEYAGVTRHAAWHGERIGFSALPLASYTSALVQAMRDTQIDGDSAFVQGVSGEEVHQQLVDDRYVRQALGGGAIPADKLSRQELIEP
ncbi:ABC transporter substrate-binding protein [Blastococcus sp. Marseille-P5729]|uniref:ABC transporter substrate-binding protein n=1 Tax=Blastococcus sp. Marseille-P5729 TaxID=2086582 RepID=UPI000D0E9920|nr:ABC transporter substrate-binding protein [Blastococcus sp. Marseille-P5729]